MNRATKNDRRRVGDAKSSSGRASGKETAKAGRAKPGVRSRPGGKTTPGAKSGTKTGAKPAAARGWRPGARSGTKAAGAKRDRGAGRAEGLRRWWTGEERKPGRAEGAAKRKDAEAETAAKERRSQSGFVRVLAMLVAFAGMVAFAGVLSRLTLEPSAASAAIAHTNLEPGSSIQAYLSQPAFRDTVKQLGGNIALGVPFGVLLPVLIPRARGFLRVTLATAVVMLLVELVQGALINGRAFDVDDVILNSTGAFLGYLLLGRRLGRAVHPPRRRWWQRLGRPVAD
ncbi:hypothetical protein N566_19460 [Streptomycetaceae bacterium MP113-05]|nr:hypothetical protein N566_19460 [Streptomycetaceae bacterium MP113-05]